jgi:hypothetical protein
MSGSYAGGCRVPDARTVAQRRLGHPAGRAPPAREGAAAAAARRKPRRPRLVAVWADISPLCEVTAPSQSAGSARVAALRYFFFLIALARIRWGAHLHAPRICSSPC